MTRIVLDTNIIISAIISSSGNPRTILDQVFDRKVSLCLSPPLIAEILRVIDYPHIVDYLKKRGRTIEQAKNNVKRIIAIAEITSDQVTINRISADPDDNRILECAIEARPITSSQAINISRHWVIFKVFPFSNQRLF